MKKITLLTVLLVSMLAAPLMAKDTVRLGTEGAYAPYNYVDDSGKLAGFEIDLGNALCKEAGMTCEWVVNEWDSIIPNLIAGNYDGIMAGMSVTAERQKTIAFSAEYYPVALSLYTAAKGNTLNLSSLKGKKIGVQGATMQADYVAKRYGKDNTILSFETFDQSVADLMAGNIDLLLTDSDPILPVIKASKGALVLVGDGERIGGGVAIGMRQKDAELTKKFNAAIAALKANGELDKLIKKYFDNGPFYSN